MTVRGTVRGQMIELDEALPFPTGQIVSVQVEPVASAAPTGSPSRLLEAVTGPPHISVEDAAELNRAIEEGKIAASDRGIFDAPTN